MEKWKLPDHEVNTSSHIHTLSPSTKKEKIFQTCLCLLYLCATFRKMNAQRGFRVVSTVSWVSLWAIWQSTSWPVGVEQNAVRTVTSTSPWKTSSGTLRSAPRRTSALKVSLSGLFCLMFVSGSKHVSNIINHETQSGWLSWRVGAFWHILGTLHHIGV